MRNKARILTVLLAVAYGSGIANACTIFTVCRGDVVLFGNNEDYTNPKTHYWVIPSEEGKYGGVYFGFDDSVEQGGVNEKGLTATPANDITPQHECSTPLIHPRTPTVDYCRSILDAVHVEGPVSNTLYSNVIDLSSGVIYLYHWHQWDEVVTLDIAEQLAKGSQRGRISDLFSSETTKKASDEYQRYKKKVEKKKPWWKFW